MDRLHMQARVCLSFLAMALRSLAPVLLAVVSAAPLVPNDGHPLCQGMSTSNWPSLLCRNDKPGYFCMWHTTMDIIATGCDFGLDCESSYICTALKCYNKMCSDDWEQRVPEANLKPSIDCLTQKCPAQAQAAKDSGALDSKDVACPDNTTRRLLEAGEQHV